MRISILGPAYPFRGGIAYHTSLLALHLKAQGEDVQFLTYTRQYPKLIYGRDDKEPGPNPLDIQALQILDSLNPLTWVRTARLILEFNPEIVYLPWWVPFWAPVCRLITSIIKRNAPQTKIIILCHNVLPHEPHWYDRLALRVGVKFADKFIVHSPDEQRKLTQLLPNKLAKYTPHPTYQMMGNATEKLNIKKPYFLFAGIVRSYKGVDILIKAFASIAIQYPKMSLIIAGEFWDDIHKYVDLIDKLKLNKRVKIINRYVNNDELASFIQQASAIVLPYRKTTQSGMAQLALGKGTPVITTNLEGMQTTITDHVNGLLVKPNSEASLAQTLKQYIDLKLEKQLRKNIKNLQPAYSWETLCRLVVSD